MTACQPSLRTALATGALALAGGLILGCLALFWTSSLELALYLAAGAAVVSLPALALGFVVVAGMDFIRKPVPAGSLGRALHRTLRPALFVVGLLEVLACPAVLGLASWYLFTLGSRGVLLLVGLGALTVPWVVQGVGTMRVSLQPRRASA